MGGNTLLIKGYRKMPKLVQAAKKDIETQIITVHNHAEQKSISATHSHQTSNNMVNGLEQHKLESCSFPVLSHEQESEIITIMKASPV